ncbi:MAG: hypothetical protein KJ941_10995 [Bacteroidetes bacterium]|nr:hypothetical protein [Bacteroidota bacterium]
MQKSVRSEYLRQLARNLNILEGLTSNLGNTVEVHELELNRLGYDITLFTHVRNRIGERQDYLYHFMVKNLGNGRIQLTKTEEKFDHHPIFYRRWEKEFPEGLSVGG